MLSGTVTDCDGNAPLAYATLEVKGKENTIATTDVRGRFRLVGAVLGQDTLVLSCPGYHTQLVVPQTDKEICLKARTYSLQTLTIKAEESTKVVGRSNKLSIPAFGHIWNVGFKFALPIFPAQIPNQAVIKRVGAYVTKQGKPQAPFRFRLMSIHPVTGAPDADLVVFDKLSAAQKGGEWVFADVPGGGVVAPPTGFFIVVENVFTDSSYYYTQPVKAPKRMAKQIQLYGNRIAFGRYNPDGEEWNYTIGRGWGRTVWFWGAGYKPMFGAHEIGLQATLSY